MVDRDGELVPGQAEITGQQGPGQFDGVWLEIVAEGEVAQHLEEGVVASGIADIVQVVVLAAGANTFLGRGRPGCRRGLGAREDILERHHPGIDEQQGRIVLRDQRRRGRHGMALASEVVEEGRADVVQAFHGGSLTKPGTGLKGKQITGTVWIKECPES